MNWRKKEAVMTEQNENAAPQEQEAEELEMDDIFGMITTKVEELKTDSVKKEKEAKKQTSAAPAPPAANVKKDKQTFKAPFQLYAGSVMKDVTGFFEDGKEYTGEEISKIMLAHDEYFFASRCDYDYISETNTVVAMSVQHKKG